MQGEGWLTSVRTVSSLNRPNKARAAVVGDPGYGGSDFALRAGFSASKFHWQIPPLVFTRSLMPFG